MDRTIVAAMALLISAVAAAAEHAPEKIIPKMKQARLSLMDGIALAEKNGAVATSAKFEITNSGVLQLSVYVVPEGLGREPEAVTLTELAGDTAQSPFKFETEVFQDKEHIARSAVHMTMFQLSRLSLKDVLKKANAVLGGVPIDVRNPRVRDGKPVADVTMALPNGASAVVRVDLISGQARRI